MREVNEEAVERLAFAVETARESLVCPFCGMWWDQGLLRELVEAHDFAGAQAYLDECRAAPINAQGDDLGERAPDG